MHPGLIVMMRAICYGVLLPMLSFAAACDRFNPEYYPRFKAWCDEYFTIKHRCVTLVHIPHTSHHVHITPNNMKNNCCNAIAAARRAASAAFSLTILVLVAKSLARMTSSRS